LLWPRGCGLKVTPQRQLSFCLLNGNTAHPSAEILFATAEAQLPGISLRTVLITTISSASIAVAYATSAWRVPSN